MATVSERLDVDGARRMSERLLTEELPRRWAHTVAVAAAAVELVRGLASQDAEEIVCAAWLHDIGYAPSLVDSGFHPIDGAAYLSRHAVHGRAIPAGVIGLIAHHTGAVFEAHERGLQDVLARYPVPDAAKLAIVSCADLCSGPDGTPVDPDERITEVLARYPAEHPVHRAIAKSGPMLVAQTRRVIHLAGLRSHRACRSEVPVDAVTKRAFLSDPAVAEGK